MELIIVDFTNYKEAIEVQRRVFPNEDGTLNILASLNRELFIKKTGLYYIDDHVKYYLGKKDNKTIGITGLYNYGDDTDNAWIAWYGILPEYRCHGYGAELLQDTINLAKQKGFKYIRLYTDINENADAIKLYEKAGFIGEKYNAEKLNYDCYIFSKSLLNEDIILWSNKVLDLAHQSELDQADDTTIRKALEKYE